MAMATPPPVLVDHRLYEASDRCPTFVLSPYCSSRSNCYFLTDSHKASNLSCLHVRQILWNFQMQSNGRVENYGDHRRKMWILRQNRGHKMCADGTQTGEATLHQ